MAGGDVEYRILDPHYGIYYQKEGYMKRADKDYKVGDITPYGSDEGLHLLIDYIPCASNLVVAGVSTCNDPRASCCVVCWPQVACWGWTTFDAMPAASSSAAAFCCRPRCLFTSLVLQLYFEFLAVHAAAGLLIVCWAV